MVVDIFIYYWSTVGKLLVVASHVSWSPLVHFIKLLVIVCRCLSSSSLLTYSLSLSLIGCWATDSTFSGVVRRSPSASSSAHSIAFGHNLLFDGINILLRRPHSLDKRMILLLEVLILLLKLIIVEGDLHELLFSHPLSFLRNLAVCLVLLDPLLQLLSPSLVSPVMFMDLINLLNMLFALVLKLLDQGLDLIFIFFILTFDAMFHLRQICYLTLKSLYVKFFVLDFKI